MQEQELRWGDEKLWGQAWSSQDKVADGGDKENTALKVSGRVMMCSWQKVLQA